MALTTHIFSKVFRPLGFVSGLGDGNQVDVGVFRVERCTQNSEIKVAV